jgi:peptidoglycan/xylan/chitin deacetylase (PgdA/CDA1 family)
VETNVKTELEGTSGQVAYIHEGASNTGTPSPEAALPAYSRDHRNDPGAKTPISLRFAENIEVSTQARIDYTFRVFAAIYGYQVVEPDSPESSVCCIYGGSPSQDFNSRTIHLPSRYRSRCHAHSSAQPLARLRYANEDFYLFHGIDERTGNPDWLGEIFEWISSSHELGIFERDSEGRISYADTIFARQQISPRKPHATMLMAWFENYLRRGNAVEALPKPPSPVPGIEHIVICSHDIDFYYTNTFSALFRLLKNLVISFRLYRSWEYFSDNYRMILELLGGRRVGDYLPALLSALRQHDTQSTLFVVSRKAHRRDPNYRLEEIAPHLASALQKGFSVGLHASYESVVERNELQTEVMRLREVLGKRPLGSRQHWLRFHTHEKLFEAVEAATLAYDSSLGFAETPGFRNGASFAFPPYDFKNEKPYNFLEIPLVLMDGNLEAASRLLGEPPQEIADGLLHESRSWSWGGIALLWHNPIEPLSVPSKINRVFWNCAAKQREHKEKWMSAEQFLKLCLARYQNAGLMKEARIDA